MAYVSSREAYREIFHLFHSENTVLVLEIEQPSQGLLIT